MDADKELVGGFIGETLDHTHNNNTSHYYCKALKGKNDHTTGRKQTRLAVNLPPAKKLSAAACNKHGNIRKETRVAAPLIYICIMYICRYVDMCAVHSALHRYKLLIYELVWMI